MQATISKRFSFDAAHRLLEHRGKCRHLHGHTYEVEVYVTGEVNDEGMVADYAEIKTVVNKWLSVFDHSVLAWKQDTELINMCRQLETPVSIIPRETTAENIAIYLRAKIAVSTLREYGSISVTVSETRSTSAHAQ